MEKIYFISDIHIGAGTEIEEKSKINKLFSFLDHINAPQNKLFIVGDLFDFWFEYKHVIPNRYFNIFYKFHELIKNGVEIHFLPGNHDFWIRDFFQDQVGIITHPEEFGISLQSKKIFLFHGDGISKQDKGYQILKKIFRNPVNIFFFRWLHPDVGIPLMSFTSNTSRKHTADLVLDDEDDYTEYAIDKFNKGFDVVVVGHSHKPLIKNIDGKYLINLGDWIKSFSYGKLNDGKLTLNYWNSKK